jgi:Flp pilus assembly protein TadB
MLKIKRDNQQITVIALVLYGLIMLSLILIYRDLLITITAVTIMAVLLVQYFVPLLRERKKQKADAVPRNESEK